MYSQILTAACDLSTANADKTAQRGVEGFSFLQLSEEKPVEKLYKRLCSIPEYGTRT